MSAKEFYDEMSEVATELLSDLEFGSEEVFLIRRVDGVVNTVTAGWETPPSVKTYKTCGVRSKWLKEELENTQILKSDIKVVIDGSVKPVMGDVVKLGDEELGSIQNIDSVVPIDKGLAYIIAVRR